MSNIVYHLRLDIADDIYYGAEEYRTIEEATQKFNGLLYSEHDRFVFKSIQGLYINVPSTVYYALSIISVPKDSKGRTQFYYAEFVEV